MWIIYELFEVMFLANICSVDWPLATEVPKITAS